jgi:hypothetical protein
MVGSFLALVLSQYITLFILPRYHNYDGSGRQIDLAIYEFLCPSPQNHSRSNLNHPNNTSYYTTKTSKQQAIFKQKFLGFKNTNFSTK